MHVNGPRRPELLKYDVGTQLRIRTVEPGRALSALGLLHGALQRES